MHRAAPGVTALLVAAISVISAPSAKVTCFRYYENVFECIINGQLCSALAVLIVWLWSLGTGAVEDLAWIFRHQGAAGARGHMYIFRPLLLLVLLPCGDATHLLLVRHGRTFMNEHLSQPGKAWGAAGFVDPGLWDTRLTPTGMSGTYV